MTRKRKYLLVFSLLAAGAFACVLALMLRSNPAGARTEPQVRTITLGQPILGGPGCPLNSARATLSADGRRLTILFDEYMAETRPGRAFARSACNIAVPVAVPPGLSVSLLRLDYRGFVLVPRGGRGLFRAEYFFAGIRGPELRRSFAGGFQGDYLITDRVAAPLYSPCGDDVIARVNSSIEVQKASPTTIEEGIITVDSTDITTEGIIFYLDVREC
jgi:hypothetical protein